MRFVIFAAFWNDEEMVRASIPEIESLDPDEVYVSEGCFDNRVSPGSTDGTYAILQQWQARNPAVRILPIVRKGRLDHIKADFDTLCRGGYGRGIMSIVFFLRRCVESTYRLNQSETFNFMLSTSENLNQDFWFVTYDADEFFDAHARSSIRRIRDLVGVDMLVTREITFWGEEDKYAPWYPQFPFRTWNVPFRHKPGMRFVFTRELYSFLKPGKFVQAWKIATIGFIGSTLHFKLDGRRVTMGLSLGNRKAPSEERVRTIRFISGVER